MYSQQNAVSRTVKRSEVLRAPKMDPLDILIRYRRSRRHRDFDLRRFVRTFLATEPYPNSVCPETRSRTY